MIENLSNISLRAILDHIQAHFADFLRLPHYKQTNLAEKAVTELVKHQEELNKYCIYCISLHDVQEFSHCYKTWEEKCDQKPVVACNL